MKHTLILLSLLSACGSSSDGGSGENPTTATSTATSTSTATATTPAATTTTPATTTSTPTVADIVSLLGQVVLAKSVAEQPAAVQAFLAATYVKTRTQTSAGPVCTTGVTTAATTVYQANTASGLYTDSTSKLWFLVYVGAEGVLNVYYQVDDKPSVNRDYVCPKT